MKPLFQKLPKSEQSSFVSRIYTTPFFETSWHQHEEIELIVQLKGNGKCFVGNYTDAYETGDIFLLGSNLPHEFKKENQEMICSVMVVHFNKDFFGELFWSLPECEEILELLDQSMLGIKLKSEPVPALAKAIIDLEKATGFERIALLINCLLMISRDQNKQTLSTINAKQLHYLKDEKIDKVFEYSIKNFNNEIDLITVAGIVNLSVPAFCKYFKIKTKKTYVEFLTEMRIGYACQFLINSNKSISEICYACGFNTVSNFNKQFLKVKNLSPSQYKKTFNLNSTL